MINFLHNLDFYQTIVKGIAYSQNYGFFPMYINAVANGYMGSFSPVATPHLLLYIPATIYRFTKDISLSFNIFFLFLNLLQFVFMYICLRGITGKRIKSLMCSLLYLAFYLFTLNFFIRIGLAEYMAITFIPLVIFAFYDIYFGESKYRILLLVCLFFIAESSVSIFAITLIVMLAFCIIFFVKSIFNMKILRIVFVLVALIILTAFTYVPMVHYYLLKQFSIVDVVGNVKVIITTLVASVLCFAYVMVCKKIIEKLENKIFKIGFMVIILLFTICSGTIYSFFLINSDKMYVKENIECVDEVFIPKVGDDYNIKNEEYLKKLYEDCGTSMYDVVVRNYTQSYLHMNIEYEGSTYYKKVMLDIPYFNMIGFRSFDKNGDELPLIYGEGNVCRVIVPSGEGLIKIGFIPPMMWTVSLVVSILGIILLILIQVIKEVLAYKKILKIDKEIEKMKAEKEEKEGELQS